MFKSEAGLVSRLSIAMIAVKCESEATNFVHFPPSLFSPNLTFFIFNYILSHMKLSIINFFSFTYLWTNQILKKCFMTIHRPKLFLSNTTQNCRQRVIFRTSRHISHRIQSKKKKKKDIYRPLKNMTRRIESCFQKHWKLMKFGEIIVLNSWG